MRSGYGRYIFALIIFCAITVGFLLPSAAHAEQAPYVEIQACGKSFIYKDEYITPSDFTVREQIDERRINAPISEKTERVRALLEKGAGYARALDECFPLLKNTVNSVAREVYIEPQDAKIVYKDGKFSVSEEKSGRALDEDGLYAALYCALCYAGGGTVKAHTAVLEPEIKREELLKNIILRGEYSTGYYGSTASRSHNIELALSRLDGLCIKSGDSLSFNAAVGERTEQNGYKSAKIIVDGKYTEGIGGGVCQASTAVYNAALAAGLTCAANAHSLLPSYCPPGLDAMISSVSDLVITNTTGADVYISAKAVRGKATVRFYGKENEYTIIPTSEVIKTVPYERKEITDSERTYFAAGTPSGDRLLVSRGNNGVLSSTYLDYYTSSGEPVKRVKIRSNEYKPSPEVIAIAP